MESILDERWRVFSGITRELAASTDLVAALREVARPLVPSFGDWCAIVLERESDPEPRIVLERGEKAREGLEAKLIGFLSRLPRPDTARARVLGPDELADLGMTSVILAPMVSRKNLGVLALGTAANDRLLGAAELEFAQEVARHVSLVIDVTQRRIAEEERARVLADAEASRRSAAFLAEAGKRLAASLDAEVAVEELASLMVPTFADWCFVDLVRPDGSYERVVAECSREEDRPIARQARRRLELIPGVDLGISAALAGKPHVQANVDESVLRRIACDDEHLATLRAMRMRSFVSAPLATRGGALGVLSIASCSRNYTAEDLSFVEELASRAAVALENARLFREAQAAIMAAREAERRKDEFLAMLGHELRNPLAPMVTALQLMRLRGASAFARERGVLERQVEHMARLIDDLLDVSRITRGRIDLKRDDVDLGRIVRKAVELAGPLLESRSHALELCIPEGIVVNGDETRLVQVVTNLLTNAAKYTEPHGHISIRALPSATDVLLAVRDDGIGIPTALLPRIFDLFVQGERSIDRSLGGLGLGLTIVRSIVDLHGGSVEASSEGPGRGSEFRIRLPRVSAVALARPAAPATSAMPSCDLSGVRVLVVDDNREAADVLVAALTTAGAEARAAYDGPSALVADSEFNPSVALLDIGLPVMDGYELARRLRAHSRRMRLIAVTGYGQESDRLRAIDSGFDEHFVKPVDLDSLFEAISPQLRLRELVDRRRARRD